MTTDDDKDLKADAKMVTHDPLHAIHLREQAVLLNGSTNADRAFISAQQEALEQNDESVEQAAISQSWINVEAIDGKGFGCCLASAGTSVPSGTLLLLEDPLVVVPNGSMPEENEAYESSHWAAFMDKLNTHFGSANIAEMHKLGKALQLPEHEWLAPLAYWLLDADTKAKVLSLHAPDLHDSRVQERFPYLDKQSKSFVSDDTLLRCSCFHSIEDVNKFRQLVRIFDNNSLAINDQQDELALMHCACRFSHSCFPNCARSNVDTPGATHGRQAFRALRQIDDNEELTISYISDTELLESTMVRNGFLNKTKFFICTCERCSTKYDPARTFNCPSCGTKGAIVGNTKQGEGHKPCSSCGMQLSSEEWNTIETNEEQLYENVTRAEAVAEQLPGSTLQQLIDMERAASLTQGMHFLSGRIHNVAMRRLVAAQERSEALEHLQISLDCESAIRKHPDNGHGQPSLRAAWLCENKGDLIQTANLSEIEEPLYEALVQYQKAESMLCTVAGPRSRSTREVQQEKAQITGVQLLSECKGSAS